MKLIKRCWSQTGALIMKLNQTARRSVHVTLLILVLIQASLVTARPSKGLGLLSRSLPRVSTHDWCANSLDSSRRLQQLQASLKSLKSYDWQLVLDGLDTVFKMTVDAWNFSDSILGHLVQDINDDEVFINEMANVYLTYAPSTPEAVRVTEDNSVEQHTSQQNMADHIQTVLIKQTENLARMLARLELLHQTEKDLGDRTIQELMYGSMGETQFVLCAMQHLFNTLSPGYDLPGRYSKDDLSEFEQDTLGTSHHIRMYAAYGVIMRHSDIIQMVKDDIDNLSKQVEEHTKQR